MPRVVADALPAADHVEVFLHFGQKPRDFVRIILQIGVEGHHQVAPRVRKAGGKGRRLAKIAPETQTADARIFFRQPADDLPGIVARTVIDENDVQFVALALGHRRKLGVQGFQAFGFVIDGNDDGEHGWEG